MNPRLSVILIFSQVSPSPTILESNNPLSVPRCSYQFVSLLPWASRDVSEQPDHFFAASSPAAGLDLLEAKIKAAQPHVHPETHPTDVDVSIGLQDDPIALAVESVDQLMARVEPEVKDLALADMPTPVVNKSKELSPIPVVAAVKVPYTVASAKPYQLNNVPPPRVWFSAPPASPTPACRRGRTASKKAAWKSESKLGVDFQVEGFSKAGLDALVPSFVLADPLLDRVEAKPASKFTASSAAPASVPPCDIECPFVPFQVPTSKIFLNPLAPGCVFSQPSSIPRTTHAKDQCMVDPGTPSFVPASSCASSIPAPLAFVSHRAERGLNSSSNAAAGKASLDLLAPEFVYRGDARSSTTQPEGSQPISAATRLELSKTQLNPLAPVFKSTGIVEELPCLLRLSVQS